VLELNGGWKHFSFPRGGLDNQQILERWKFFVDEEINTISALLSLQASRLFLMGRCRSSLNPGKAYLKFWAAGDKNFFKVGKLILRGENWLASVGFGTYLTLVSI
jgi:hypothetical protein